MELVGIAGLEINQIREKVNRGWRFLQFEETRSFLVFSQRKYSSHYFIAPNTSHWACARKHVMISALFGWWSIPWGVVGTPMSIIRNLRGGNDTTQQVMTQIEKRIRAQEHPIRVDIRVAQPRFDSTTQRQETCDSDEPLWAQAMAELDNGARRNGLWAKMFAEANGDEPSAKAAYLVQRVAELKKPPPTVVASLRSEGYKVEFDGSRWTVIDPGSSIARFYPSLQDLEQDFPGSLGRPSGA